MTETETISDVVSAMFILFVGYLIIREFGGLVSGSVFGLAFEFVKFAFVVGLLFLIIGVVLQLLD